LRAFYLRAKKDVSGIEHQNHQDYREEARRIRTVALDVKNVHARVQLLLIASLYEKLAEHVGYETGILSDNVS
jgi:hypothetical protein